MAKSVTTFAGHVRNPNMRLFRNYCVGWLVMTLGIRRSALSDPWNPRQSETITIPLLQRDQPLKKATSNTVHRVRPEASGFHHRPSFPIRTSTVHHSPLLNIAASTSAHRFLFQSNWLYTSLEEVKSWRESSTFFRSPIILPETTHLAGKLWSVSICEIWGDRIVWSLSPDSPLPYSVFSGARRWKTAELLYSTVGGGSLLFWTQYEVNHASLHLAIHYPHSFTRV